MYFLVFLLLHLSHSLVGIPFISSLLLYSTIIIHNLTCRNAARGFIQTFVSNFNYYFLLQNGITWIFDKVGRGIFFQVVKIWKSFIKYFYRTTFHLLTWIFTWQICFCLIFTTRDGTLKCFSTFLTISLSPSFH